jgi:hypothetical protein
MYNYSRKISRKKCPLAELRRIGRNEDATNLEKMWSDEMA